MSVLEPRRLTYHCLEWHPQSEGTERVIKPLTRQWRCPQVVTRSLDLSEQRQCGSAGDSSQQWSGQDRMTMMGREQLSRGAGAS